MVTYREVERWKQAVGRPFIERLRNDGGPWILDRTVALFRCAKRGIPVMYGTGVLLRIADARFILSASHVLRASQEQDTRLLVSPVSGVSKEGVSGKLIGLHDADVVGTEDLDDADFGFVRLSDTVCERLAEHKRFLTLADLDCNEGKLTDGMHAVIGFPVQMSKSDHEAKLIQANVFHLATPLYRGKLAGFTEGVSIALAYERNTIVDETLKLSRPPDLNTISGCGMWRLCDLDTDTTVARRWTTGTIRLVGIEHGVVPNKAIKGVRVCHVVQGIADVYPELVPSIKVTLGEEPKLIKARPRTTVSRREGRCGG